jgi:hypothetical protein
VLRRLAIPALLLALVAWVVGTFAAGWHDRAVRHITCHEHGEVLDAGESGAENAEVATLAPVPDRHGHEGCGVAGFPPLAMLAAAVPFGAIEPPIEAYDALAEADARTRGPLLYAPKTSPPSV